MAKPLWTSIHQVESELGNVKVLWLGLDFDGTLAPLALTPDDAMLAEETRSTLTRLSSHRSIEVAVISGRALHDVRSKIGLEGITYVGNHGMQIEGKGIKFEDAIAGALRPAVKEVALLLHRDLSAIPGVFVESKDFSLSIHYRLADPSDVALVESRVETIVAARPEVRARVGAKTIEILPISDANKGAAIQMLLALHPGRKWGVIYIGDDATDEDAFKALPDAITIRVGAHASTSARFHVDSPAEVLEFLNWLLRFMANRQNT